VEVNGGGQMRNTIRCIGCFLMLTASPAFAGEAFVTQLATAKSSGDSMKSPAGGVLMPAMLASPLQLKALGPAAETAPVTGNASSVAQYGTNNLAVVAQTGATNQSAVVQHGAGNQALVTQRGGAH
jgi:hypothetical protein